MKSGDNILNLKKQGDASWILQSQYQSKNLILWAIGYLEIQAAFLSTIWNLRGSNYLKSFSIINKPTNYSI